MAEADAELAGALAELLRPRLLGRRLVQGDNSYSGLIGVWVGDDFKAVLVVNGCTVKSRVAFNLNSLGLQFDLSDPGAVDDLVAVVDRLAPAVGRQAPTWPRRLGLWWRSLLGGWPWAR